MIPTSAPLTSKEAKDTSCNQLSAYLDSVNTELKIFLFWAPAVFPRSVHLPCAVTLANTVYSREWELHKCQARICLPVPASPRGTRLARLSSPKTETGIHSNVPKKFPGEEPSQETGVIYCKGFGVFLDFWDRFMKSHCIHGPLSPILHQHCPLQRIKRF